MLAAMVEMQLAWPIAHVGQDVPNLLIGRWAEARLRRRKVEGVVAYLVEHRRRDLLKHAARLVQLFLSRRHAGDQLLDITLLGVGVEAVERLDQVRSHEPNAIREIGAIVGGGGDTVAKRDFDVVARHRHRDDEASVDAIGVEDLRDWVAGGVVVCHAANPSSDTLLRCDGC